MPIHLLPSEVASQIAAGEVVERPASVIKELLENALDAKASQVSIHVEGAGKRLVEIADNGCGIPRAHLDQVLEPFFTTKAPGEGTGLGLALVYSSVRDMDRSMEIESPLEVSTGRGQVWRRLARCRLVGAWVRTGAERLRRATAAACVGRRPAPAAATVFYDAIDPSVRDGSMAS